MANRRSAPKSSSVSKQGRMLFAQLEHQYADATRAEWDELAEHMSDRVALLSGGSEAKRAQLQREFEAIRDKTLAGRHARNIVSALAAGAAKLDRDRGDGIEEWTVANPEDPDAEPTRLYVPAADGTTEVQLARVALLTGRCAQCRRGIEISSNVAEVVHNSQCPARKAVD